MELNMRSPSPDRHHQHWPRGLGQHFGPDAVGPEGFRAGLAVGGKYDEIGVGGFGVARNQGCRFLLVCSPMRSPPRINGNEAQRRPPQETGP